MALNRSDSLRKSQHATIGQHITDAQMNETKIIVGRSLDEMGASFIQSWKKAESGQEQACQKVISFESWEALASLLTPERYRLLKHLREQSEESISSLARNLHRNFRRVHDDVKALEEAGLIKRIHREIHGTTEKIRTEIVL